MSKAAIVRRIYREYLAGITITRICRGLEEDGIPTKLGKKRWQHSVVSSILTNEKYTGDPERRDHERGRQHNHEATGRTDHRGR